MWFVVVLVVLGLRSSWMFYCFSEFLFLVGRVIRVLLIFLWVCSLLMIFLLLWRRIFFFLCSILVVRNLRGFVGLVGLIKFVGWICIVFMLMSLVFMLERIVCVFGCGLLVDGNLLRLGWYLVNRLWVLFVKLLVVKIIGLWRRCVFLFCLFLYFMLVIFIVFFGVLLLVSNLVILELVINWKWLGFCFFSFVSKVVMIEVLGGVFLVFWCVCGRLWFLSWVIILRLMFRLVRKLIVLVEWLVKIVISFLCCFFIVGLIEVELSFILVDWVVLF